MNRSTRIIGLLVLLLAACAPEKKLTGTEPYLGPTETMAEVVARINANNSRIPTLWAHHAFEATIIDEKKKSHFVNGFGALLYSSPTSLRLTAKKEVTDLFDLGENDSTFWLHMVPDQDVIYWGHNANIGQPCMQQIPIRPDLLLQVLGVSQFNADLTKQPAPVMRFNNDADAYMFVWQIQLADRWVAQKEIWYDRKTLRPSLVLLFDVNGRVVVRAWLSDYKPVFVPEVKESDRPEIATRYRLFFPDSGTKMSFNLSDMTLSHNGFPKPVSFRMPDLANLRDSGVKVNQIDEDCGH